MESRIFNSPTRGLLYMLGFGTSFFVVYFLSRKVRMLLSSYNDPHLTMTNYWAILTVISLLIIVILIFRRHIFTATSHEQISKYEEARALIMLGARWGGFAGLVFSWLWILLYILLFARV